MKRGFKMNRDGLNFGEGTGSNPLKHDPDGYYASKEKEVAPKEVSEKPVVNNEAPETTVTKKKSSKELFDQATSNEVDWKKDSEEYDKHKPWSEKVGSWLNKYISY
jgi:hypothetical protein